MCRSRDVWFDFGGSWVMTEARTAGYNNKRSNGRRVSTRQRLERLQVCVSKDLLDRCWNIASIDRVTVASLVEEALSREFDRREDERGEPYPERRNGTQVETDRASANPDR